MLGDLEANFDSPRKVHDFITQLSRTLYIMPYKTTLRWQVGGPPVSTPLRGASPIRLLHHDNTASTSLYLAQSWYNLATLCLNGILSYVDFMDVIMGDI